MCLIFHKWGKWEYFYRTIMTLKGYDEIPYAKRRTCQRCGKIQERKV